MLQIFTLLVLVVYFWYWTTNTSFHNIPKPLTPEPSVPNPINFKLESDGKYFRFLVDGRAELIVELPQDTILNIQEQKLLDKDDCFGILDGSAVVATGQNLYKYLRKRDVASTRQFQVFAAADFLQNGNVFYFTCQGSKIHQLEMCPSGEIFLKDRCRKINPCLEKPPGYTYANLLSLSTFYECPGNDESAVLRRCKENTFFFHDSCRKLKDFNVFCRNRGHNASDIILLNSWTRLVCQEDGRATFKKCPKGQLFFEGQCESADCLGKPDGTRIAMEQIERGLLRYHPGYKICQNHRVKEKLECPKNWNKHFATDIAALSLPKVFDGTDCAIPEYCINFWTNDPNCIIPTYDFLKYVRNWKYSKDIDNVVGYICENGKSRKRKAVPYGHEIDSKRFKILPSSKDKTFLPNEFNGYYDKNSQAVVPCPNGQVFDGTLCRPEIYNAFSHNGLGLFRMADEEWIRGWKYLSQPKVQCAEPESVYLETYNACFHPDCVDYPFLSQALNFFIALREKSYVCHGKTHQKVSKSRIAASFDYWSQRRLEEADEGDESCVPGSKIKSGHFVFDSVIYATCDHAQPFVFCPYKNTNGIILVDGKRWACRPMNTETSVMDPGEVRLFEINELKAIRTLEGQTTLILNNVQTSFDTQLEIEKDKPVSIWADKKILLVFRYLHTFPPEVAYKDGKPFLSNIDSGGALMMKRNAFTSFPVALPKFAGAKETLSGFDAWLNIK